MKKLLLLLLLVSAGLQAQIVDIPDPVFKAKLLSASPSNNIAFSAVYPYSATKIDSNDDGEIQVSEALNVRSLVISNSNISSLEGIASFSNLKSLNCKNNLLTSLDVTDLSNLQELDCSYNQLQSMNINNLALLYSVDCSWNQLTVLSLDGLPGLVIFKCTENTLSSFSAIETPALLSLDIRYNPQLNAINLAGAPALKQLSCSNTGLTSLDVSFLHALEFLYASDCNLVTLSLGNHPNLNELFCFNNAITSLNLSGVPNMSTLSLYNNSLTSLDINQCLSLTLLDIDNNPIHTLFTKNGIATTLILDTNGQYSHICCDVNEISAIEYWLNLYSNDLTDIVINPYCFLTPGGNYNGLSGSVTYDIDNDGCDAQDPGQPFTALSFTSGNNQYTTFSLTDGAYLSYITGAGAYTIAPAMENPSFFTVTPPVSQLTLTGTTTSADLNFCVTPNGTHHDVEVIIAPLGGIRPGFDASYAVTYRNKGNQVENGQVSFQFDDDKLDLVSTSQVPANSATGSLSWNFTGLLPYESRTLYITLNANSPIEMPPVNIGDIMVYNGSVALSTADENPNDNTFTLHQTVVGSYDPNDITCLQGNIVNTSLIGQYLYYNINFENTGNYPAENIVVNMKMDTSKFDMGSLQFLGSSHQPRIQRSGDLVEFFFEGIQLPANGKGNVLFKIKTKNTLVTGNSVSQKADIYFDFNAPVATNTATTTFQQLGMQTPAEESFALWPNPASNLVTVSGATEIETISLFNLLGQEVARQKGNGRGAQVDVSLLPAGNYLVRVKAAGGEQLMKLVKK